MKLKSLSLLIIGLALLMSVSVQRTYADASLVVNTLSDADNNGDGVCSLREAITAANNNANYNECTGSNYGADTITFSVSGTITLGSTLPDIVRALTIDGSGQSITVSGNNSVRVIRMFMSVMSETFTVKNLTIANGRVQGESEGGAGIQNVLSNQLNVINSTFSGNTAACNPCSPPEVSGGGIYNNGTLNVTNSTFVNNSATCGSNCTARGGAIANDRTLNVTNSTFVNNSVTCGSSCLARGGGISNRATLNVTNSTFSGNGAATGGGIFNQNTLNFANTIVANSTSGSDCINDGSGNIGTNTKNLIEDGSCSPFVSGDPNLGPLAPNGGDTETMALQFPSPALEAGDDAICDAPPVNKLDQRGITRPQDTHCDIGAFERVSGTALGTAFTYQGQLKSSGSLFTGTCDMEFSLYRALTNGAQDGTTQTLNGIGVTGGFFTVQLDFGAGVFTGEERYLQIDVKCGSESSYTTLAPRQRLTAVPYALFALNSSYASDRNAKQNFSAINSREILERVVNLPIQKWNYKSQDTGVPHMGVMAQDFRAAFGLGTNDTTIASVDADGVALAAIQGLNEVVVENEARITALEKQNAAITARLTTLENPQNGTMNALLFTPLLVVVLGVGMWIGRRRGGKQ